MDIAKYTLEDWLLWGVLPEDLKIENEDLKYTRFGEREPKRVYKYGFMDWYNGFLSEDDIDVLYEKGELSVAAMYNIPILESLAYLKMLSNELWQRTQPIKEIFKNSFMKREMLADEIDKAKAEIEEFKSAYSELYVNALVGSDERKDITSDVVIDILCSHRQYYMGTDTAFEIIIKSKYLSWLIWLNSPNSYKLPEPTFKEEAKPLLQELLSFNNQLHNYKEDAEPYWYTLQRQAGFSMLIKASPVRELDNSNRTLLDKQKSYTWLGNDEELPKLYQLLIDNTLIHSDTTLEQFKAVFDAKPLQEIKQPIKWHDDNASELVYFILALQGSNDWPNGWLIEKEERTKYKRLTACFAKPDGREFTEKLRQAKQNLKTYELAPAKKQIIDSIIKQF